MTNLHPIQLNNSIKQIVELVKTRGKDLSYTELSYYHMRISREITKLYNSLFTYGMPVEFTKTIQDKIDYIEGALDLAEKLMESKPVNSGNTTVKVANFSELTERLKNLH